MQRFGSTHLPVALSVKEPTGESKDESWEHSDPQIFIVDDDPLMREAIELASASKFTNRIVCFEKATDFCSTLIRKCQGA